jgi:hypothetical protein
MKAEAGAAETQIPEPGNIERTESSRKFTMIRLPGEILQAQMEN